MATLYEERSKLTSTYQDRDTEISEYLSEFPPESEYQNRDPVTSIYEDRDIVIGESDARLTCGKRYKWEELIKTWNFYHVSWDFLNGSPCTNYSPRVPVL